MATAIKQKLAKNKAKKSATVDKKSVDEKVLKSTVTKAVSSNREVKYKYPEDVANDQLKMKKHRAKLRSQDAKHNADIAEAIRLKKDPASLQKAYAKFRKENYLVP